MKVETNSNAKHWAIKVSIVVIISLMLLIPLAMIDNVISNREMAKIQALVLIRWTMKINSFSVFPSFYIIVVVVPFLRSTMLFLKKKHNQLFMIFFARTRFN